MSITRPGQDSYIARKRLKHQDIETVLMTNCSLDLWIGSHLHSEGALLNQRDFPLESLHTTRALVLSITLPCVTETNVSCPNQPVNFIFCITRQLRGGHKWQVSSKEAYKELQGGLPTSSAQTRCAPLASPRPTETNLDTPKRRQRVQWCSERK